MSHTGQGGAQGRWGTSFPPVTARSMRFIAESLCERIGGVSTSAPGSVGTERSTWIGAGVIVESPATPAGAAALAGEDETIARGSSAGANPEEAGRVMVTGVGASAAVELSL